MKANSSRRNFLAAGLSLPAARLGATPALSMPAKEAANPFADAGKAIHYGTLGKTGLKVTKVAFGCMITSDGSVIERAIDMGINYFDTARGYQGGNNERMLGAAMKGKRDKLVISSKTHSANKEAALKDLETSLKELGTDHLDIWYLHARGSAEDIKDDLVEAQLIAKKQGKVRFIGVSTHGGQESVFPAVLKIGKFDVVLTAYNFTLDKKMEGLVASLHNAGIGVVAMKVMAGGFRKAKPGSSLYTKLKKDGAMVAALKWVLKNPNIDTTIPSMTDMDQLDDNFKAMASSYADTDEKLLAEHLRYIAPLYCRMCGECDGTCAQGLPVADMLRVLTYADGYGQFSLARERFRELPAQAAEVRCDLCPTCTVNCPHGLKVAQRLSRAQELFA